MSDKSKAEMEFKQVSDELKDQAIALIRKYAATKDEVNSKKLAVALLARKAFGLLWQQQSPNYPTNTHGILIRQTLEDNNGWSSKHEADPLPGHRVYYQPQNSLDSIQKK